VIFTYWSNPTFDIPPSTAHWWGEYPAYTVFSDNDVIPLLDTVEMKDLYRRIALPAAKSDLARLLLLRRYGGLYVDAHTGPTDGAALANTLDALSAYDLVLFSKWYEIDPKTQINLINGVIAARKQAKILDVLISKICDNMIRQSHAEEIAGEFVPYHLYGISGTGVLIQSLFRGWDPPLTLKNEFQNTVYVHKMSSSSSAGFLLYNHYQYRRKNKHWSEREKEECLFFRSESYENPEYKNLDPTELYDIPRISNNEMKIITSEKHNIDSIPSLKRLVVWSAINDSWMAVERCCDIIEKIDPTDTEARSYRFFAKYRQGKISINECVAEAINGIDSLHISHVGLYHASKILLEMGASSQALRLLNLAILKSPKFRIAIRDRMYIVLH
jgi:hypothetical protein